MTNETTASQPKSIVDDAQFLKLLTAVETAPRYSKALSEASAALIADIDSRAPAAQASATIQAAHPDDIAVDMFACAMRAKMAASRAKGRSGWNDPHQCNADFLQRALLAHSRKGDPVDVGNFAMMLWNRGESTAATSQEPVMVAEPVADELHFNAQRLRNVALLVGLVDAIPDDDATLDGARGAVLGMIAGRLRGEAKIDTHAAPMVADPAGVAAQNLELVIARLEQIAGNFTEDPRNDAEEALVCARAIATTKPGACAMEQKTEASQAVDKLLPCAFCGSFAVLKEIGNDHTKTRSVQVKCANFECRVERTDKAMARGMEWLRAVAIENWNRRAAIKSQPAPTEAAQGNTSNTSSSSAQGDNIALLKSPKTEQKTAETRMDTELHGAAQIAQGEDSARLDFIEKHAIKGASYRGITSANVLLHEIEWQELGLRAAIDKCRARASAETGGVKS